MQQAVAGILGRHRVLRARAAAWLAAWAEAERGRFAPWLSVFMGTGALAYFGLRAEPPLWIGAALLAAAALACAGLWPSAPGRAAALAALAAALGFGAGQVATWRAPPLAVLPRTAAVLTARVAAVEALPDGSSRVMLERVRLAPGLPPLARRIRVHLRRGDAATPRPGDRVRLRALARPPPPPAYPGAWDLQRDDFFDGIGGYGRALGPLDILRPAAPGALAGAWERLRAGIARRVMAALPGARGAIAATLLTGIATAIPEADRAAFRDAGLAHLLAIAGLHIGIVMGLAMGLARFLLACSERASLWWPTKQIAALAALGAGGLYLALTGAHLPTLRSFAMACLVVLALLAGRRALSLRGLAFAAACLILTEPEQVTGVSFQMSFSAVLALIAGYEALGPALRRLRGEGGWRRRVAGELAALVLTSLLAGTASLPFAAWHFGRVQIYYVVANLVAVPLTAFWVMPAGLVALALMPLGLEHLALVPMGWGIGAVLAVARAVSAWPAAALDVPHLPGWGLAVLALGLAWLGLWRSRARRLGVAAILVGLASVALARPPDLLVSPDARLIGVRTAQGLFVQKTSGGSRFVQDSWARYLDSGPARPLPATGTAAQGAIACDARACRIGLPGRVPALVLRGRHPDGQGCPGAAIVLSAEPARRACPPGVPVVDRFSVWHDGAAAVWLAPAGPRIVFDRALRGDRPWVPPDPGRRRYVDPRLKMAPAEKLPPPG